MRLIARLFAVLLSLALLAIVTAAGAILFLSGTETGHRIMRERTQGAIARLVGPAYASDLGEQTFEIRPDGTLAVGWNGVSLTRVDRPEADTEIRRVAFAVRLLPLVGGGVEFGRLEVEGAAIDLATFLSAVPRPSSTAPRPPLAEMAAGATAALERQLAALNALSFETVEFSDITVTGLPPLPGELDRVHIDFAELSRRDDKALDLAAALSLGPLPLSLTGEAMFDEGGRLDDVSLRSSPADIGLIAPTGPQDNPRDERPFGLDADLGATVQVDRDPSDDRLVSEITITSGPGELQTGRNRTRIEEVRLRLRHREGDNFIEIAESPFRFTGASFSATGRLEPTEAMDALRIAVSAPNIRSTVGLDPEEGEPLDASFEAHGFIRPSARIAEMTSLAVRTAEGRLEGSAVLDLSAPQARTRLAVDAFNLSAAETKAFWPFNIAGRARHWVVANLGEEGKVPTFSARIDVARERLAGAFGREGEARPAELQLDMRFEGAALETFGELPGLYEANGAITTRGSRTRIALRDAMVEGQSAVALGASSLVFSKPRDGNRRDALMTLRVGATGSATELLRIADRPPIRGLRTLPFGAEDVSGMAEASALARLRIGDAIRPADALLGWGVGTRLMDATVAVPVEGQRFANLTGELRVEPSAAVGDLDGTMDGFPAAIDFTMPVGPAPTVPRDVRIALSLTEEMALGIAPALRGVLSGPVTADLRDTSEGLTASVDLTGTRLAIPAVAWTKGTGVPASVDARVVRNGEVTELQSITVGGSAFRGSGSATLDGGGLRSARLTDAGLNPGDSVALSMDRSPNGFSMAIDGQSFDARPLLEELRASAGRPRTRTQSGLTFDIEAQVDAVQGFGERVVRDLALNYASHNGRLAALSVSGIAGGGRMRADVSPRAEGQSIGLAADDLGAMIGFAGLYANMEGGAGQLELIGTAGGVYQGRIAAQNITLVNEPRLERFVGSSPSAGEASLSQALGQPLTTSRAFFDQASASLFYGDGRLAVSDGIIRGPVFGSSFAGTLYDREGRIDIAGSFMPAYTVNRIFGAIPLVGQILGNGNEGGLLGITFHLGGAFASPTVTVNPISIIAPGIFRQIFEY